MRDEELQVLGVEKKRKKYKKLTLTALIVILTIAMGTYFAISANEPERVKTGKKIGEPTILPELQAAVDTILLKEMEMLDMLHGQVIVMEVQTGEILAMVGLERNYEGKYQPCLNFTYQQELGAMTKTASIMALLESGKAKLSDRVNTGNGIWTVENGYEMKDHNWRRDGYGEITLERALEVSSNIGISKTVHKAFGDNPQEFFDLLEKMSYGQPESIEGFADLKVTNYSSPKDKNWHSYDLLMSSIGYNRKIAPIQMLTFYNAIANNGKMIKPTLKTGVVEIINPKIASTAVIDSIQLALEHVVSQGLGRKAGSPLLRVAGKTGTSQVATYEYGEENYLDEYQVGFCGYFPADTPKYSIIVSMNKLGLPASGGMASVVFHDIMDWMIAHEMFPLSIINETTRDTIKITQNNIHAITDSLSKE